jgi:hypothetical protein
MKLWSFDARSKGQPGCSPVVEIDDLQVCGKAQAVAVDLPSTDC